MNASQAIATMQIAHRGPPHLRVFIASSSKVGTGLFRKNKWHTEQLKLKKVLLGLFPIRNHLYLLDKVCGFFYIVEPFLNCFVLPFTTGNGLLRSFNLTKVLGVIKKIS